MIISLIYTILKSLNHLNSKLQSKVTFSLPELSSRLKPESLNYFSSSYLKVYKPIYFAK